MPECTRAWGIRVGKESPLRHHLPDRNDFPEDSSESTGERADRDQLHQTDRSCGLSAQGTPARHAPSRLSATGNTAETGTGNLWENSSPLASRAQLCEAWITEPALAVDIEVTDVFHQTPGPGTGEKV